MNVTVTRFFPEENGDSARITRHIFENVLDFNCNIIINKNPELPDEIHVGFLDFNKQPKAFVITDNCVIDTDTESYRSHPEYIIPRAVGLYYIENDLTIKHYLKKANPQAYEDL